MGNYWSVALTDFIDATGAIVPQKGRALQLALFFTEIVAQANNYDAPTTITCRRRPQRRPCGTPLTLHFDTDNFDVLWFCPVCNDNGRIGGWERTFWDNSDIAEATS